MYLDNAATTKVHPKVKTEMEKISYANYNAKYYKGAIDVKNTIDLNIQKISKILNVDTKQLVFTSGATESNNYIIKGLYFKYPDAHFITSDREHKCVIETFEFIKSQGADVTIIEGKNDIISYEDIKPYIKSNTKFVSIMAVNNETGIINNFEEISCNLRKQNILYHSDITQAVGKIKFDFSLFDYASLSAHKISGPKGIGLAIINLDDRPISLIHGSEQQNSNRAGTLPNELVIGICCALELSIINYDENQKMLIDNRNTIIEFLDKNLGNDYALNFCEQTVPNIISIRIKNEINQIFLKENSDVIAASTGSSCSIGNPSYVLKSHGFSDEHIQETIRLSTSMYEIVKF